MTEFPVRIHGDGPMGALRLVFAPIGPVETGSKVTDCCDWLELFRKVLSRLRHLSQVRLTALLILYHEKDLPSPVSHSVLQLTSLYKIYSFPCLAKALRLLVHNRVRPAYDY